MQTIQDLLNRIRWDENYSRGYFEIGFDDHQANDLVRVPFETLQFDIHDHFFFHYYDENGEEHDVPLHRIKSVYKNGELIWHREH